MNALRRIAAELRAWRSRARTRGARSALRWRCAAAEIRAFRTGFQPGGSLLILRFSAHDTPPYGTTGSFA